jgi:hypothetical protein
MLSSSQGPQKATLKDINGTVISSNEFAGRKAALEMLKEEVFVNIMRSRQNK